MAGGIDWFRWHHGSVTDPKFQLIAKKAGVRLGDVMVVWAFILENASASADRGRIGTLDFETLDFLLGAEEGAAARILDAMTQRGLVEGDGRIARWEARQPKREREDDTAAQRKRNQRAREAEGRQGQPDKTDDDQVTQRHTKSRQKTPRGEERREEESSDADASGGAAADFLALGGALETQGRDLTDDEEKLLWNAALALLMPSYSEAVGGPKQRDAKARNFVGGLGKRIKDAGAARRVLFDVIQAACVERPGNPETWLSAAVAERTGKRQPVNRQEAQEQRNQASADEWAEKKRRELEAANES